MKYAERLQELRYEKGLSQLQVAQIIGVSQRTYSNYEHGDIRIPVERLITLARHYNVSMDYISGVTDSRTPFPAD